VRASVAGADRLRHRAHNRRQRGRENTLIRDRPRGVVTTPLLLLAASCWTNSFGTRNRDYPYRVMTPSRSRSVNSRSNWTAAFEVVPLLLKSSSTGGSRSRSVWRCVPPRAWRLRQLPKRSQKVVTLSCEVNRPPSSNNRGASEGAGSSCHLVRLRLVACDLRSTKPIQSASDRWAAWVAGDRGLGECSVWYSMSL
jgi:hypothetical protein